LEDNLQTLHLSENFMRHFFIFSLLIGIGANAQSIIQSVNSGAVVGTNSAISVGEIVVNPASPNQSASGLIGILAQNQMLSVEQLDLAEGVSVYPNPTTAGLFFKSKTPLTGEAISVVSPNGQEVLRRKVSSDGGVDLTLLTPGVYIVRLESKNKTFKIVKN